MIFYGPTGKGLPSKMLGGGERGCLRTIELYRRLNIDVVVIEKPTLGRGKKIFIIEYMITPILFVTVLMKNRKVPVHIVGFYENQMFYEFIMFLIARMFGRKTSYELRNGTMVKTFKKHHWLYRRMMQFIIEHAAAVLCQGTEYVMFIEQHWHAHTIYYPNYVLNKYLRPYNAER